MPVYKTKARSKAEIKKITKVIRKILNLKNNEPFPVIKFIEILMSGLDESQFTFIVVEDKDLKYNYAETDIKNRIIKIRQSIYNLAVNGDEDALKIIKHELGHYFLHRKNVELIFAKSDKEIKIRKTEDPEWQADIFAESL